MKDLQANIVGLYGKAIVQMSSGEELALEPGRIVTGQLEVVLDVTQLSSFMLNNKYLNR